MKTLGGFCRRAWPRGQPNDPHNMSDTNTIDSHGLGTTSKVGAEASMIKDQDCRLVESEMIGVGVDKNVDSLALAADRSLHPR